MLALVLVFSFFFFFTNSDFEASTLKAFLAVTGLYSLLHVKCCSQGFACITSLQISYTEKELKRKIANSMSRVFAL